MCIIFVKYLLHCSTRNSWQRFVSSWRLSTRHSLHDTGITWIAILLNWDADLHLHARCEFPIEMAISNAKVAKGNFCTQESLCLLCTPLAPPIIQARSPINCNSTFLTPGSFPRNAQLSKTLYSKRHTHHHQLTHTHHHSLPPISLQPKHTSMSFFPIFYPTVAPPLYDKISAHLHRLHVWKKTIAPPGLAWYNNVLLWLYEEWQLLYWLLCPSTEKKDRISSA